MEKMTAAEVNKTATGHRIAEVLKLVHDKKGGQEYIPVRFKTAWGDKTALGIYETVRRIIAEGA